MTVFDGTTITIDPSDYKGMLSLMARANEPDFEMPWSGKNDVGENMLISVNSDNITVQTFQSNGWTRENVYWNDGTVEELFER